MIIKLSPVRSAGRMTLSRLGDMLTINGLALDFANLPEGGTLPAQAISSSDVVGPVERIDGKVVLTLRFAHGADAPEEARFPADIVDPPAGPVPLPGVEQGSEGPAIPGVIDWSQVITAEAKAQAQQEQMVASVTADIAQRRAVADQAIEPLRDAVELGRADQAKRDLLTAWQNYRLDLFEIPEQAGYPTDIDWPAPPA
ncbi:MULTISPECIES: tail fiber assembly protein [unclassified Pseudomonas]|uniref:tail fiber assembly protein n=1 Tax=unclassified Pseudomonas TaxID=196821 RepID=UPI003822A5D9